MGGKRLGFWQLMPDSNARPLPAFIPEHIRKDYVEACRVINLSANSAATMARRCLQNMIRDFCGISKARLNLEINELKALHARDALPRHVQPDTIEPIDHLRAIGNFGAHMDQEVNMLLDVTPDEARHLVALLEALFDEWYVAREERRIRLEKVAAIGQAKEAHRAAGPPNNSKE